MISYSVYSLQSNSCHWAVNSNWMMWNASNWMLHFFLRCKVCWIWKNWTGSQGSRTWSLGIGIAVWWGWSENGEIRATGSIGKLEWMGSDERLRLWSRIENVWMCLSKKWKIKNFKTSKVSKTKDQNLEDPKEFFLFFKLETSTNNSNKQNTKLFLFKKRICCALRLRCFVIWRMSSKHSWDFRTEENV